jgi:triosephosphate isomerase (TIM)
MKKYFVIGNWKNNPNSKKEAENNFKTIKAKKYNPKKVEVVVCPSFLHLNSIVSSYKGKNIKFGAQNFYLNDGKSYTGEIMIDQLKEYKLNYVIIGHAERRLLGETDELVAKKIKHAIENKIKPVLCIGELERDSKGEYLKLIEKQLRSSISNINEDEIKKIIIAYEPLWAIGTNKIVSPSEIHVINILIKKILTSKYSRKIAFGIPILYGGSVDPENCNKIIKE